VEDSILSKQTALEFFRELVADTLSQRRLKVRDDTEFYLVNLLAEQVVRSEEPTGEADDEPLVFILKRALEASQHERWRQLKRLGDTALFVSGFFGDSLSRSLVDVDYYIAMGERAYDTLSEEPRGLRSTHALFGELARRFTQFVDLYAEIAELSDLHSSRGLIRMYERFLLTGSQRVAERLRERGVALFSGPGRPRTFRQ
jgi:hypothetical protein